MKNILIIVESGNKTESIHKYIKELQSENLLNKEDEYTIAASVGHILELPKSWMPVADEQEWNPKKRPIRGKAKVINELKAKAKKADIVYVATDPDREGEAIAKDLVERLAIEDKYQRMVFNEITKESILEATKELSTLDEDLIKAQKARLYLDRMMGYKLSTWIKKKIWNASPRSAGRVQSPTLKLVVEREIAIEGFSPEPFVKIEQEINDVLVAPIVLKNNRVDGKSTQLKPEALDEVKSKLTGELTVKDVKTSTRKGATKIPFKQSAVYRAASSMYGMSAAASRSAMQALFEKGYISYPRTDSTRYSNTFIKKTQAFLLEKYGEEYVSSSVKGQAKGKQDAHEALRITSAKNTPERINGKLKNPAEVNMYRLIYTHTLQTLMNPPIKENLTYVLDDNGYDFKLSSSKTLFPGYNIIKTSSSAELELPVLKEGDKLKSQKINYTPGETKPPARFNEGSLIEKMEEVGVGRPSTFSSTVGILQSRGYVEKEGSALVATRLGKAVSLSLMAFFGNIIKEDYTKSLEDVLDEIAVGKKDYKETLAKFWGKLLEELDRGFIKYKQDEDDSTQIIDLTKLESESKVKPHKETPEHYGYYNKSYMELIATFMQYVKITKKEISIDWDKFIDQASANFKGPIMMPLPPKRGAYILNDKGEVEIFFKNKEYKNAQLCPVCKKHPLIFRGTLRRGRISWFQTCSGFPVVKCNHIESIDEKLQDKLEAFYQDKLIEFKEEDRRQIIEYTQNLKLSAKDVEMTQTILLSELDKD